MNPYPNPNLNPNPNYVSSLIQPPAIALIVTGAINGLLGLVGLLSGIAQFINPTRRPFFRSEAEQAGYYIGQYGVVIVAVLTILASPFVIVGAVKMLKTQSLEWAKASAILAVIPFTSCCCLLGIPVGIWALVVLAKPEVKAFFNHGRQSGQTYQPPPPSQPPYYGSM